jgi:hypothetical protein
VCETTKHPLNDSIAKRNGYGICHKVIDSARLPYDEEDSVLTPDMAFTVDGSGYMSSLFTGPEHGCVLFEAGVHGQLQKEGE